MSLNPYEAIGAAGLVPHPIAAQFLTLAADTAWRLVRARAVLAAAALLGFLALLLFTHLHATQAFSGTTVPVALALGVETFAGRGDLQVVGVRVADHVSEQSGGKRGQHLAARTAAQPACQGIEALGVHHALLWTVRDRKRRCFGIGGWRY
jgi:hypothetical protein